MGDLEKYRFKNSYLYRKKLRKNLDEDDMRDDKVFLVGMGRKLGIILVVFDIRG